MLHLKYISRFFISKIVPKYLARKLNLFDLKISDFGDFLFVLVNVVNFVKLVNLTILVNSTNLVNLANFINLMNDVNFVKLVNLTNFGEFSRCK